ncbi:hypothetical protein H9P43_006650 [Blastocladiella emersonii ATCC 22665]|nr:hypothetical protein H9P43_006650 [Blastocladiella emersonii ATCC 22665]
MPCKQVPGKYGTAFGLKWFHGKDSGDSNMGPQRTLLSELQDDEMVIKRLVDKGVDKNGQPIAAHYFAKVKTANLAGLLDKNRCIQEMVHPDRLSKVYFDIDCPGNRKDVTLDVIKKVILTQFPGANLQVCGYETDLKKSWHIVISNYTVTLKDMPFLKLFCSHPDHVKLGFDSSVYSKHRFMKCINQSKPKKTPGVWILGNKDRLSKHLIQCDFDPNCVPVSDLSFEEFVSAEAKAARAKRHEGRLNFNLDIPKFEGVTIDPDFFYYDATPLEILHNIPISPENAFHNNVTWRIMTWAMRKGVTFDQFWAWTSQQDNSAQRMQKYWNRWNEIASNDNYQVPDSLIKGIFLARFPDAFKSKAMKQFKESLQVPVDVTSEEPYLSGDDITTAKFNVLAAGMGSNKTGAVCDYIAKYPNSRVVWITPRITLAHNTEGRLNNEHNLGFVNYCNVDKKTMGDNNRLIVSPCSLHYISKPYDIVVVDESETVLKMFQDDTLHKTSKGNNLVANLIAFKTLCEHKDSKGIFMDAFITNLTMDVLRSFTVEHNNLTIMSGKIKVIKNKLPKNYVPRKMTYIATKKNKDPALSLRAEDVMERNIIQDLQDGKKLYLFIPRKIDPKSIWSVQTFGEHLERVMGWKIGEEIKVYHGDRPADESKELVDPDTVWGKETVRVVIANLKITVGVNFSEKRKFDKVYARYESWFPICDFFQAIYRVCNPIDNEIVFMAQSNGRSAFINRTMVINTFPIGDMHSAIVKNSVLENEMAAVTARHLVFDKFHKIANIVIDNCPKYYYEVHPEIKEVIHLGWSFDWANVKLPSEEVIDNHVNGCLDKPTWTTCLSIRKSFFVHTFKGLTEADMEFIWDSNAEGFMEQIKHFYTKDAAHVLHKILEHNNMDLRTAEKFDIHATVPAKFNEGINKYFKRVWAGCGGNAAMLSQLLNTYFNKKITQSDKEKPQVEIAGKRYTNFEWTDNHKYFALYKTWTTAPAKSAPFVLELDLDEL